MTIKEVNKKILDFYSKLRAADIEIPKDFHFSITMSKEDKEEFDKSLEEYYKDHDIIHYLPAGELPKYHVIRAAIGKEIIIRVK